MNDFLTEKNKKTGALGKLKWVLCVFCILFTLGAIGASEKYIGEGRWGMAATEIILEMCIRDRYNMVQELVDGGTFLLNCAWDMEGLETVSYTHLQETVNKP